MVGMVVSINLDQDLLTRSEVVRCIESLDACLHCPGDACVLHCMGSNTNEAGALARGSKTLFDVADVSAVVVDHIAEISAAAAKPFQVHQELSGMRTLPRLFFVSASPGRRKSSTRRSRYESVSCSNCRSWTRRDVRRSPLLQLT